MTEKLKEGPGCMPIETWRTLKGVALMLMLALIATLGWTGSASAQTDLTTTHEIDTSANAISNASPLDGYDWDSLYAGFIPPNLDIYTGVIPDFGADDTTRFGEGTKDIQDIPDWAWQALPPNDKVDVTNGQAALYSPIGFPGLLYFAIDRFANNGDASIGVWLLQDSSVNFLPDGTWSGQHVAGIPGDTALVDPRGDILIIAQFTNGGAVDSISVFEWVASGGDSDDSLGNQGADQFDVIFQGAGTAFATVNQDTATAPWPYTPKTGAAGIFPASSFLEAALDLGALFGDNIPCFAKFLYTSRESQSLTAAVKDFGLGEFATFPVVSVNDEVICDGDSVQLCATVQPGTGVGPFTYLWSTGDTTQCIWVSATDSHSVVVTGDNGCPSATVWGSVTVEPTPDLTCSGDHLTCDSTLATASVTVNNAGALGALTYVWSPAPVSGQGTAMARYDTPGDKMVTVTSATGCVDSCFATITQDTTKPDLTCAGDLLTCDSTLASATVTVNNPGELGSLTYVWSPAPVSGQGTAEARYDSPGVKKVVVTDLETGCVDSCNATITQDIVAPDLTCAGDHLTCDSTLASATVTINNPGELGSLSYVWSPAPISGQGTDHARYDSPGVKKVVVTDLETGCVDSCTATITQDITAPDLTCAGDTLTCDSTLASATVTINNPGELGTVTYVWSPAPVSGQGTAEARYDAPGDKKVVVTDLETGCVDSCTATIIMDATTPDLTCAGDLLTCDSTLASATVTVNNAGSLGSLTYVWSPEPISGQGTNHARYDTPGAKKVVVTDVSTGCADSCNATITQDIVAPDLTCAGDLLTCDSTLASATVTVNNPGELGSLTYVWSPAPISGQGTDHARYDTPGVKKVVVTDLETGCVDSCNATITQDIVAPDLTCAGDHLTCDSTLASATVTINNPGELGSLSYVWSPAPISGQGTDHARYDTPGVKKVVVTDLETGCVDSCNATITQDIVAPDLTCAGDLLTCDSTLASATVTINNPGELGSVTYVWSPEPVSGQGTDHARYDSPGSKKVVVTDLETGCVDSCNATITQDANVPDLTCAGDHLTCDSTLASATVTVNNAGSLGSLTYVWSPAPISGQGTNHARYDTPGAKKVIVTDVSTGCADSCTATITQDIVAPDLTCAGDLLTCDSTLASATVTVNNPGELGSLTYVWSPAPISGQGTDHARYDTPGVKKVVVTDLETGCVDSCNATITQDIVAPDLTCAGDHLTCDSTLASATVTVNNPGELGSLTYVWSPAPISGQGTDHARYDAPGVKKVVVTDLETGCVDSCNATITQDTTKPDLTCAGDLLTCDSTLASATVTVNNPGELGSLTYVWSPEPVSGQGTAEARYDSPGSKKVVVTDLETGCVDSCDATITQDSDVPDLTCAGDIITCDSTLGSATVTVNNSGDLGTLSYVWSPAPNSGQGTAHARYDACGTVKVIVTDITTGCADSCSATITCDTTTPDLTCSGDTVSCDSTLGSAMVTVNNSGELGSLTYAWSPEPVSGQGTNHARYSECGEVKVLVTDVSTGCVDSCTATIVCDTIPPTCSVSPADTTVCDGESVTFCVTPSGGVAPYTYAWSGPNAFTDTDSCITVSDSGLYKVVVTGANGCVDTCEAYLRNQDCGDDYCTFTMGGWGTECPEPQVGDLLSTQPGCIRDNFFDQIFPSGVTIGDPAGFGGGNPNYYSATWTSSAAVMAFLPAGETPGCLTADLIDPTWTPAGVLAGQVLALTLNREFTCSGIYDGLYDDLDIACLGNYVIDLGCGNKFAGITVDSFLVIANMAVGGKKNALNGFNASLSDVNYTATCLNEKFNFCNDDSTALLDSTSISLSIDDQTALPDEFGVAQNYPNPFNPSTKITMALPEAAHVTLEVFNILGRRVATLADGEFAAGFHTVTWEAAENASGVYLYRFKAGAVNITRKMVLLK